MPFVAAPGVAALQAVWTQEGQTVENTFHYHKAGTWDLTSLEGIADTYMAWASTNHSLWTDVCALVKVLARDLTTAAGAEVFVTPPTPILGTATSGHYPNNVTWALKRQTGLAGRKNRGRVYLIGMPGGNVQADQQTVNPSAAAAYASAYDGLISAQLSDNSVAEVILHRTDGTSTPVINYTFSDLTLDSQRRRLPNHNRHR